MQLLIILSIALTAGLIFWVSIRRLHGSGAASYTETPLAVRIVVSDGMRTLDKVLRPASLLMTVVNGREGALYEAVYRIGEGPECRRGGIRGGEKVDFSNELLLLREYGSLELKGYIACQDNPSERIVIDTTVWMAYFPAYRFLPVFRVGGEEDIPLNEQFLTVGDEAAVELPYSPHDTFLHVSARVTELPGMECPVTLHEEDATNREGLFRLPFTVTREGACILTVLIENGRDRKAHEYRITGSPAQPENHS